MFMVMVLAVVLGGLTLSGLWALSADGTFSFVRNARTTQTAKVKASTTIYRTALVGLDRATGYARGLVAGDMFLGIAADKAVCGTTAGAVEVVLHIEGEFKFALSGVAVTDIGKPAFASADATLTLTGAGNSYVGKILDVPEANYAIVRIDPLRRETRTVTAQLWQVNTTATKCSVAAFRFPIVVVGIQVWAETKPDAGSLNVGTDASDPDELVDAYNLTGLTNAVPSAMTLAGTEVAKDTRIWALVGGSTATPLTGGGLAIEYYPLP